MNVSEPSVLRHLADLIEQTRDLDYDPSVWDGAWVCGAHGIAECTQGDCPNLPWPESGADQVLDAFTAWARGEFLREVRPYDEGRVPEMPEESFRTYSVWEWPLGAFLEALQPPAEPSTPTWLDNPYRTEATQ